MNKKQIILPTKRFANADAEDIDIRIGLDEEKSLLREGDRNIVLDINELFYKERNESKNYKIHGKIKMVFRNMYSGTTSYEPLLKNLYLVGDGTGELDGFLPYNEFAILRNDVVREIYTGYTVGIYDDFPTTGFTTTGYTGHTAITPIEAPYHNWNVYLSYVYSGDTNHPMIYTLSGNTTYSFVSGDGIPFRVSTGATYTTLTSPVEHGILKGEHLLLSGQTDVIYISDVGNEFYNSEKYVLNILNNDIPTGLTLFNLNFYEKNNHIGSERFAKANFTTNITDNTLFKIETDRNLKTDFTNFHKLAIENENECIRYGLYLQRNYFSNNDLRPATSIFFGITLLPFGENYTSGNVLPSVGGKSLF
jgi:hypothetical protein